MTLVAVQADAFVLEQAQHEVERGLLVHHRVRAGRVDALEPRADHAVAEAVLREHLEHHLGHGAVLEHAALTGESEPREQRHQHDPGAPPAALQLLVDLGDDARDAAVSDWALVCVKPRSGAADRVVFR